MDIKWKFLAKKDPAKVFETIYDLQLKHKTISEIAIILGWNNVQSFYTLNKDKYLPEMVKKKGLVKCLNCGGDIPQANHKRFCSSECCKKYHQKTRWQNSGKKEKSSLQYTEKQLDSLAEFLKAKVKAEKKRIAQEKEFISILEMRLKGCSWEEIAVKVNKSVEYTRLFFYRLVKSSFLSECDNYDVLKEIVKRKRKFA